MQELTKNLSSGSGENGPDVLSRFGADKHSEGLLAVETLPEENVHLGERPEEHQVSVDSKQFLPHLQARRLWQNIKEKEIFFQQYLFLYKLWHFYVDWGLFWPNEENRVYFSGNSI